MKLNRMLKMCVVGVILACSGSLSAQQLKLGVAPTVINPAALLELNSDQHGLLLNRVPLSALSGSGKLANAPDGMIVYVTDAAERSLYVKKNNSWQKVIDLANLPATSFKGRTGNIVPQAGDYDGFYVPNARNLTFNTLANGVLTISAPFTQDLSADRTWSINANNTSPLWNANSLNSIAIDNTTPANGDVLTMVAGKWKATPPASGSFIIANPATPQTASFNITGSGIIAGSASIGGAASVGGAISANSVTTTANIIAGTKINTPRLGVGIATTDPNNVVEISTGGAIVNGVSGLRLTGLGTAATTASNGKLLSVNSNGDVIVTNNPNTTGWNMTGNSDATATSFLGTTTDIPMVVKYNGKELFRGTKGVGAAYENSVITLFNGATPYNAHPFIIRANGNDVMAFQDAGGNMKFHWNLLGNGLNFVESGEKDYRIMIKSGGFGVGIDTSGPNSTFHVNGSFSTRIRNFTNAGTIAVNDTMHTIFVRTTGVIVNLPDAVASNAGREYRIKMTVTGTFQIRTVSGQRFDASPTNGQTIITIQNGNSNGNGGSTRTVGAFCTVVSDGTRWYFMNSIE
ncbi:hypothetical protein SAMN05444266_101257 [Chitinophaga jiangningensis]|uniref:Uncharacterized protein n=1 Tax=Chitinophaga jiangningensis TaxID=1419482 RepID=A0A1M6VL72_9BACT|nr:hypothetical protein [Chitinophaga jiangningensis]SHK82209.1 hypothetical protein SAMN05444266_101257 [Chitinophaga jiangningensis]